jgi:hypothetical protein
MGYLTLSVNVGQPACRARFFSFFAPKKQCGLYLDWAKAAKKDLCLSGKGLAYNVTVVDVAGDVPRIDDRVAAEPDARLLKAGAAQATPLWRGVPDRSGNAPPLYHGPRRPVNPDG